MRTEISRLEKLENDNAAIKSSLKTMFCLLDGISRNIQLLTSELEETQRKLDEHAK